MRIFVKTGFGPTLILDVESTESVFSVKRKIQDATRRNPVFTSQPHCSKEFIIIPSHQHLFYGGSRLEDSHQLREYNIQNEDSLNLFLRFRPFGHTEEHHDIEMQLKQLFGTDISYEACCNQKFWTEDKLSTLRQRLSCSIDVDHVIKVKEQAWPGSHPKYWTLLMASIHLLDLTLARELLEAGARVQFETPEGKTARDVVKNAFVTGAYCRRNNTFHEGLKPVAELLEEYKRKQNVPETGRLQSLTTMELMKMTGDFDSRRLIHSEGNGHIYKGVMSNMPVAVKVLDPEALQVCGARIGPDLVLTMGCCHGRMCCTCHPLWVSLLYVYSVVRASVVRLLFIRCVERAHHLIWFLLGKLM